ncbi:MAG: T9SS type B sorting domain-containing protein, partial [Bacteroidota bacterium]
FNDRGCTDTLNFTIREPQRNQASIQQSGSPACGNSFSLIALPSGGTAPYRYEWNGTLGDSILTDQTGGGTFSLRVIDANDCSVAEDITVVAPDPLLAPHASVPETCTGRTDGSITITPTGGTAPYSYDWGTVSTLDTNTVAGLSADAYTVTVADNDGCTFIVETTVGRGPDVQLSGDFTGASCFGDSNGRIELTTTQANAPLTYAWTGTNATSDLAEDLAAGDYSVTVTDDRGCVASQTFTITEPTVLSGSGMADNVLCFGENTGAITFAATGGTVPYRYTWNNGATTADPGSLTAGFYEVIVRDANDCLFTESFAVTENPALTAAFSIGEVSCNAGQDGQIAVAAGNGTPPYTYQWSFNNATTPQLTDVRAGFYEVQITDANGCSQNIQGEVTEPTALSVNPVIEPVRCFGETSGLIELDVNGGTPGYEFRLDGSTEWQRGNVFLGLDNGIYAGVVRDANGCIELVSNLEITEPELLTVDLGERQTVIWGENTQLGGRIRGGTPPVVEYSWTPVDTLAFSCQDCPTPFFTPNEQTTVTLRIIDEAGCVATDQITILVEKDFPVLVPTGFTPNNDQVNDVLIVHGRPDIQIEQFQVIDRWGEVIFQNQDFFTNDESAGWDGNYRDEPMVSGVYIWQAQVLYPDGKREKLSGETTLLR